MEIEELTAYCLGLPGAWLDNPWEHEHPVVKVGPGARGKIFAFLGATTVGVKGGATREEADEWLARYPGHASAMAYIGRHGWNSLRHDGGIPADEIREAVADSYERIVSKLPKTLRP